MEKFDPVYKKINLPQIRPEWLALRQEAALQPEQRIVDTHHHFWDEEGRALPRGRPAGRHGSGHAVEATVLVEAKARYRTNGPEHLRPVGETEFAVAQAEHAAGRGVGVCQGIVAWADLTAGPEGRRGAAAPMPRPARAGFGASAAEPPGATTPCSAGPPTGRRRGCCWTRFPGGHEVLTRMGLSLDVWVYHTQLADAVQFARDCPETQIVSTTSADRWGSVPSRPARGGLRELACGHRRTGALR